VAIVCLVGPRHVDSDSKQKRESLDTYATMVSGYDTLVSEMFDNLSNGSKGSVLMRRVSDRMKVAVVL